MLPAIVCGIAIWDAPVSYWPSFFLRKLTRTRFPLVFKVANEYRNAILPSKHRQRSFHGSKLFKM